MALGPAPPSLPAVAAMFPAGPGVGRVVLRGTVESRAEIRQNGLSLLLRPAGPAGRYGLIRLTVAAPDGAPFPRVPGPTPSAGPGLRPGTRLRATGRLYQPTPANPGETPFGGTCVRGRLLALAWVAPEELRIEGASGRSRLAAWWEGSLDRTRAGLTRLLQAAKAPGRGILRALLLGDRAELGADVEEDFGRAGALHLLVVSGLHLSVVSALLAGIAGRCGAGVRVQAGVAAAGALGYATLIGWQPAVTRAVLMNLAAQAAVWAGRRRDSSQALALSVLAMLAQRPLLLFDAGFRLTVAATWGVVRVGPAIAAHCGARDPLGLGWATTLGAHVVSLPLILTYFGRAPLLALAVAPVLVGFGTALVEAGCVAAALGLVVPALGRPLMAGLGMGAEALWWATRAAGHAPWAAGNLPGPPDWVTALYFSGLAALDRASGDADQRMAGGGQVLKRVAPALCSLGAGMALALGVAGGSPWLTCTFLSVGEADALHLHLPGGPLGPHLVLDTGSSPGRLLAYLRRRAVQSLEAVVVTHPHRDHSGGAAGLARAFTIRRFVSSPKGGARAETARGTEVVLLPGRGQGSANEGSRRILVRHGRFCLISTGDAHLSADDPVLALLPSRDSVEGRELFLAVKIPHHGARGAVSPAFLAEWRPDLAVISVGPNAYGHPDPELLALLGRQGVRVLRTDREGAVRLATDGRRVRLWTFRDPVTADIGVRPKARPPDEGRR